MRKEQINYKEIGKRIRHKRTEFNLTQAELAEELNLSPSYISEIERGNCIFSVAVLFNISNILEINIDYLINGTNRRNIANTFSEIYENVSPDNYNIFTNICREISEFF